MAEVPIPATSFWTFTGKILLLFIEWVVAFCRVCIGTWVLFNTCPSYTWIISTKIFDNTDTIVLNVEVFAAEKRIIGPDKSIMLRVILPLCSYSSVLTYVVGAQKNCLIETVLLSTHNV